MPDHSLSSAATIAEQRAAACRALLVAVRAIDDAEGLNESSLGRIKQMVVALSQRSELFPDADFAEPRAAGRFHSLDETTDREYGLYFSVFRPGKESGPHLHGVWCVTVGLTGQEVNRFYTREGDGRGPGQNKLRQIGECIVAPGKPMAMLHGGIHSTRTLDDGVSRMIHLYGQRFENFPGIDCYNADNDSWRKIPAKKKTLAEA